MPKYKTVGQMEKEIAELEAEVTKRDATIAKLESDNAKLEGLRDERFPFDRDTVIRKLEAEVEKRSYENHLLNEDLKTEAAQVAELREAIKTHKDSFIGDEGDICTEDDRLWALLEVKK